MKASLMVIPILIFAGCVSQPEMPKMKMAMGVPDGTVEYKKISSRNLSLKLLSKKDVFAGEKAELVFALSNNGQKTLSIEEWYSYEPDNIKLSVQPWLTGMKEPNADGWIDLSQELKKPVLHYPMTLMPGNKALVSKTLDFVEKLQVSPGKLRRYFIKAEMNLKSVTLQSEVYVLQVFSKRTTEGKSK
ncbi:MAG: hypothetical protein J6W00_05805 [Lentisphaeria bacterium]|nr:hypothetical protein [Lentisphaeria bacterium]